jgi:hypothetical protein
MKFNGNEHNEWSLTSAVKPRQTFPVRSSQGLAFAPFAPFAQWSVCPCRICPRSICCEALPVLRILFRHEATTLLGFREK